MSDLRKAAEMAVKALSIKTVMTPNGTYYTVNEKRAVEAIEALRQALAQPEREWVGLTDEEVESWRGNYDFFNSALVREVEAKLKEKNI